MNKKLQVFVSSTYTDLIEERQVAVEAILDAGHIPAGMELFKAGKSQMQTIRKWIDESDVYMLILGGRYGSIDEESKLSYIELEYNYAISKNMPVFAVVLNDEYLFSNAIYLGKNIVFEQDNIDKYDSFKKNVQSKIVRFANNVDQISIAIHAQLNYFISDTTYNLIGWIRSNEATYRLVDDFNFPHLDALMQAKRFDYSYLYENAPYNNIDAKSLFIKFYNKFKSGLCCYSGIDSDDTRLYRLVVPFFVDIGVLKECVEDGKYFQHKKAIITLKGEQLYEIYSS